MTTDVRAADLRVSGPLGDRELRRFVASLGLVYVVAILALFAKLLILPGTHHRLGSAPVTSRATGIANDPTAKRSELPLLSGHRAGCGATSKCSSASRIATSPTWAWGVARLNTSFVAGGGPARRKLPSTAASPRKGRNA